MIARGNTTYNNFELHVPLSQHHGYFIYSNVSQGVLLTTKFALNKYKGRNIRKVATIYNVTDLSIPSSPPRSIAFVITCDSLFFLDFFYKVLHFKNVAAAYARMKFLRE